MSFKISDGFAERLVSAKDVPCHTTGLPRVREFPHDFLLSAQRSSVDLTNPDNVLRKI